MIELTSHLIGLGLDLDSIFRAMVDHPVKPHADYQILADVRESHGFMNREAPLLTPPNANHKLAGAKVVSYGLTLHSFRTVLPARDGFARLVLNACPNAGHCVKVCVVKNGNGRFASTQRGWLWRTDLLARHPESFTRILAWELAQAVRKHGEILFRPNVNSDVAWQNVLPSMTNGYLAGVTLYGYSKRPETLTSDAGWMGSAYRVAYSWHETSDADAVSAAVRNGVPVAIVTSRRKGSPVTSSSSLPFVGTNVVDADKTDEWMLSSTGSVVGDLSAKGKARSLVGRSRFVVTSRFGTEVAVTVAGGKVAGVRRVVAS